MPKLTWFWLLIAACSLLGMAVVLVITSQGVGTWVDSTHYITAARSLTQGQGLLMCYGTPFVRFPPLFPASIASLMALGFAPLDGIRLLNTLAFGGIIFVSGWLLSLTLRSQVLAVLGTLAVALSWPQVLWAIHALSETVFTLLILLAALQLWFYLQRQTPARFALLVVTAALIPLQRYTGMAFLGAVGLCLLLFLRKPPLARLRAAVIFGFLAAAPLGLWVLRNYQLQGALLGTHGERQVWGIEYLGYVANPMLDWLVPPRIGRGGTLTGSPAGDLLLLLVLILLSLWLYHRSQGITPLHESEFHPGLLIAVFWGMYFVVVQAGAPSVRILNAAQRLIAPAYPLLMLLMLWALDRLALWLNDRARRPLGSGIVVALVALWLILPAEKIWRETSGLSRSDGWTGFSTREIRESPLVNWQEPGQIIEPLYSNKPMSLCIVRGVIVQPISPQDPSQAEQVLSESENDVLTLIILPDNGSYEMAYSVDEFEDAFEIEILVAGDEDDSGIYRLMRRG